HKVGLHHFGQFVVRRLPGVALVEVEVTHRVLYLSRMGRSTWTRGLLAASTLSCCRSWLAWHTQICRPRTRVEITIHRLARRLHVELGPFPGTKTDKARASEVRGGFVNLIFCAGGVSTDDIVGLVAIELPDCIRERFRRRLAIAQHRSRRLLLCVRTCKQRNLRLRTGLVDIRER